MGLLMGNCVHTPPVSPSSYRVNPSICRYPWKRSLFTHDDKLASSYSATQRHEIYQRQTQTHTFKKNKNKKHIDIQLRVVYIKSRAEECIDAGIVRRPACLPPVCCLGGIRARLNQCVWRQRSVKQWSEIVLWWRVQLGWGVREVISGLEQQNIVDLIRNKQKSVG